MPVRSPRPAPPPPAPPAHAPRPAGGRGLLRVLGPGLITGAADDDPSGIASYSAAGAAFGFGLLWAMPAALPLMAAVQLMCARIGMVSGRGLAGVLRERYPRWVAVSACMLLVAANTVNIAADLGGVAAVLRMVAGGNSRFWLAGVAGLVLTLLALGTYPLIARVLKWLTLTLLAYVASAFLARPDWGEVLRATFIPGVRWSREYLVTLVAVLGTTISPYLFFWQSSEEVEEEKARGKLTVEQRRGASPRALHAANVDVWVGMTISTVIAYFIILTTGATLHPAGIGRIEAPDQAAEALRPLAGSAAALLFAAGVVGAGLLGVSVLAGSAALAVAEAADWPGGMNERPLRARRFYAVMAAVMLAAVALAWTSTHPMRMLVWAAVLNGVLAPPLLVLIMVVCNDPAVMGPHRNRWPLNLLGGLTAALMAAAVGAMFFSGAP
ncbi:MAG TPA: Nramp family divalent metal transporter [Longimicrobium sp.]|nr:Nramp family divalent metal transporter [Longimicrobium sp.]